MQASSYYHSVIVSLFTKIMVTTATQVLKAFIQRRVDLSESDSIVHRVIPRALPAIIRAMRTRVK
jgi:hypothetical protein